MSKLLVRARNTLECAQYCYHRMTTKDMQNLNAFND